MVDMRKRARDMEAGPLDRRMRLCKSDMEAEHYGAVGPADAAAQEAGRAMRPRRAAAV